MSVTN